MAKTFEQILSDIRKRHFEPLYFLMGEEPYFIDLISDTLEENILDEADKAFNQIVVYGRDVDVKTIVDHARSFPMMGEHMVVIVKEAQDVKDIEELAPYLETFPPSTILVVNYKYKKLDKRRSLSKTVDKLGVLFESKKVYENKIPEWIQNYLQNCDSPHGITPKAVQMLTDFLGTDLHKVRNELDKLVIAVPKSKKIDDVDVERNIGISKDYNVFELQNAVGSGDVLKANRIVNYFAENKDNPLFLTAISLFGYFSKLLKLHYATDKSPGNLASILGVNPFFVRDYLEAARNYSIADCVRCIAVLREFDMKGKGYKSGEASEKELYKEMIFRIMHRV
ncbi:MAG: DNA polymerase III subunit delta [Candidatus Limimorpha sp.]